MRILFVLRSIVLSGGIERVMTEKANWLANNGHQVLFLTYEQSSHPLSFPLNSNVYYEDVDCQYYKVYQKNIIIRPFLKFVFKQRFRNRLQNKIFSFLPEALVIPSNLAEFMGITISMVKYVPVVLECHSTHMEFLESSQKLRKRLRNHMIMSFAKRCSLLITLTEGDACYWHQFCRKVVTVPNPLSYYPERIIKKSSNGRRIICVARLQTVKRIDRLIEAFALISNKYPDWYVEIYGDGPEKMSLQQMIEDRGLQGKISILPPTVDIYKKYMESDFMVLSSDSEGFSLVLIEAMSCGLPAVSVACPFGPSEIVENGMTGLLTKMDVQDLAEKMEWMIIHEKERLQMGEQARIAAKKYQKGTVMKEWERAYMSVQLK